MTQRCGYNIRVFTCGESIRIQTDNGPLEKIIYYVPTDVYNIDNPTNMGTIKSFMYTRQRIIVVYL